MSEPMNMYGAVDLSALAQPAANAADQAPSGDVVPAPLVTDVTESTFEQTVQLSTKVPVIVELWAAEARGSEELAANLTSLAEEYGGRFQHARVDAQASPQIAQAFQAQAVPTVVALVAGQPIPLFQGTYPAEQLRQVIDEVLKVGAQQGATATIRDTREADSEPVEEPEKPLPPRHAEAVAALEKEDYEGAREAYRQALQEDPSDTEARAALEQVELLIRSGGLDTEETMTRAAAAPADVEAQLAAADVELAAGQAQPALDRLLALVRASGGEEREQARARLVSFFEIVGNTPEVQAARRDLASALY